MNKFEITEIPFDPIDHNPTVEDEFTITAITREIEGLKDPKELKAAALSLLEVAMQRQAVIRGLCKRLAKIDTYGSVVKTTYKG